MKKWIGIIVLCWAGTIYAAVELTLSVPDQYTGRVLAMMRQWDHCHITIHVRGSEKPDYHTKWDITDALAPENPAIETPQQFATRFIRQFMVECVKAHEMVAARAVEDAAHAAIPPADVNVPDDVIQ